MKKNVIKKKEFKEEMKWLHKTGVPRCFKCKVNFIPAVDTITKKISEYLWKPNCKCSKKDLRVCIG